jgi:outer membrane receptor protein involved in Fe transport
MRKLEVFWLLLLLPCLVSAQDQKDKKFSVSGTIVNDKGIVVPFASISLLKKQDSIAISTVTSDTTGQFSFSVSSGSWELKVSSVAYQDQTVPFAISASDLNLGKLVIKATAATLREVVVTSEKKLIELKLDKRVYNVSQDVTNIGSNASDILANIPSVEVDIDGNVSLRGSQGVRVLIDGKPSALTGTTSTDALRNLQGAMIERIEVVTNPSSRYDAAGETGIINIVLKKGKTRGFNGNFTGTAGYPSNFNASYTINYRTQKMNLFSSFGAGYRNSPGRGFSTQSYSGPDTSFIYNQSQKRRQKELSGNIMAGIEYYASPLTTLTGSLLLNRGRGKNKNEFLYDDLDGAGILKQTTFRTENEEEREEDTELSLSFRKKYSGNNDKEWTADFKWTNSGETETADYLQGIKGNTDNKMQRSGNPAYEDNLLLQTDYILPFNENAKFETGFKGTIRKITNEYLVEEFQNGNWIPLPAFDNNMEFNEKIFAGYAMFGNKVKRFSYQLGLRGELTYMRTGLKKTNEINNRDYFNLFPSSNFSYELNDKNTLQISYSYRINRVDFRNLTPFADFSDPRVFFVGNPNLNPEYTHSFEFSHLADWSKGTLLSGVYYRHKTGVIERIRILDSTTGVTNIIPINLSVQDDIGFETAFAIDLSSWWKFNTSFNFFGFEASGEFKGREYGNKGFGWTNRTSSRMTFFKDLDFQASLFYRSPRKNTQGKNLSIYSIDLGLAKDVFKGKGTLTFNVQDLMNSRKRRSIVDIPGYYSESWFQGRPRQFRLSLNFRINQQKIEKDPPRQEDDGFDNG